MNHEGMVNRLANGFVGIPSLHLLVLKMGGLLLES